VVKEYLEVHPQRAEAVIKLVHSGQQRGFEEWERRRKIIERGAKAGCNQALAAQYIANW
jgi:hypothetical protein